jgi:hypothetical protein
LAGLASDEFRQLVTAAKDEIEAGPVCKGHHVCTGHHICYSHCVSHPIKPT